MFHFPGCPPARLLIHLAVSRHCPGRVSPFGDPWIVAYLRLTTAFRSLSRPSSAISALASTLRSSSLDLCLVNPLLRLLHGSTSGFFTNSFFSLSLCSFQVAPEVLWLSPAALQNDTESGRATVFSFGFRRLGLSSILFSSLALPLGFARVRPGIRGVSLSSSLPRKEVIQPHLPIRLPCYDFTPVISLTFDGCSLR